MAVLLETTMSSIQTASMTYSILSIKIPPTPPLKTVDMENRPNPATKQVTQVLSRASKETRMVQA